MADHTNQYSSITTPNYRRCRNVIDDLCGMGVVDGKLDAQDIQRVLGFLRTWNVTRADFFKMDSAPGTWGYTINGRAWHFKLRQVRNQATQALFQVLEANEAALAAQEGQTP